MSFPSTKLMDAQTAAEKALAAVGCGYDLTTDLRLSGCKVADEGRRLVEVDESVTRDFVLPGGAVVADVPVSIKWDKGERTRFCSDILSFNQMSEQFNQDMSVGGKIPCGHFNKMFNFSSCWQKDAASTKSLALDGWLINLYTLQLEKSQIKLSQNLMQEVPLSWDPDALAGFIEKYGTHIVVGVKMGGKDVIHLKQLQSSNLTPSEIQKLLKKLGDERFSTDIEESGKLVQSAKLKVNNCRDWHIQVLGNTSRPAIKYHSKKKDVMSIHLRKGGLDLGNHKRWLSTILEFPDVISMSFVPITSFLNGVQGCGFLSHAINLYLRYKPPILELAGFLEFQLPRQWAPQYGDLPLSLLRCKKDASPSLQYSLTGPKLYVNTVMVNTSNRPVTGIRLFLEGKKSNILAVHLQHLSSVPNTLHLSDEDHHHLQSNQLKSVNPLMEKEYIEPIKWSIFSHVCTSPVEHHGALMEDAASIVTRAWFEVKVMGMKKVLFLRLGFSTVSSSKIRRSEWEGPSNSSSRKSGLFSNLISGRFSTGLTPPVANEPQKPDINSALYPGGPPEPMKAPKLLSIVDTKEMVRGPEDHPGYWVVTGAKLCIENGKISIKVKYSLLTITSEEDADDMV